MKNAWEMARKKATANSEHYGRVRVGCKWKNGIVNRGIHRSARDFIAVCMVDAWAFAKDAIKSAARAEACQKQQAPYSTRRIVSLREAELKSLNHGRAWVASAMNVDTGKVAPHLEGELVCYIYA